MPSTPTPYSFSDFLHNCLTFTVGATTASIMYAQASLIYLAGELNTACLKMNDCTFVGTIHGHYECENQPGYDLCKEMNQQTINEASTPIPTVIVQGVVVGLTSAATYGLFRMLRNRQANLPSTTPPESLTVDEEATPSPRI